MTRSKLPNWMMFASALVVVFVIAIASGVKFPTGALSGDVIASGPVDIVSNNPYIPVGRVWYALVTLNDGGQSLLMKTASATELTSADSLDKEKPTEPVEFRFQLTSEKFNYAIEPTGFDLWELSSSPKNFYMEFSEFWGKCRYSINGATGARPDVGGSCDALVNPPTDATFAGAYKQLCESNGGIRLKEIVFPQGSARDEWYCYSATRNSLGKVYAVVNPTLTWTASFTLDPQSKSPDSVTITKTDVPTLNLNEQSAGLGSLSSQGNVYAKWVGNSVSNILQPQNNFPDVLVTSGVYSKVGSGTKEFAQGKQNPQTVLFDSADKSTALSNVVQYNSEMQQVRQGTYNLLFVNANFFFGRLVLDYSSAPIYYPNFQVFAKADWMGIFIPFPRPQIVSVSAATFQSGTGQGNVVAVVKNNGERGDFAGLVSCPSPINGGIAQALGTFNANEQRTVNLPISSQVVQQTTPVSCKLRVTDANDATNFVEQAFQVTITPYCTLQPSGNWGVDINACTYYCPISASSCPIGYTFDNGAYPNGCKCNAPDNTLTCSDGTAYGVCSATTVGKRCVNGGLVTDASCNTITTCSDGTQVNACSTATNGYRCLLSSGGQFYLNPDAACKQSSPFPWEYVLIGIVVVLAIVLAYMQFGKKGKGGRRK